MAELLARLKVRLPDTALNDEQLTEYLNTINDRLILRLGADSLPAAFQSICVDAAVKMVRRTYYEGISTESVTNISTSFVDDILSEYEAEISGYLDAQAESGKTDKVVRFL